MRWAGPQAATYRELVGVAKECTLVHLPIENAMAGTMHRRDLDGCPNYVRGWVRKADVNTMQRGYRDVGYLLAPHVLDFRPPTFTRSVWRDAVARLRDACCSGNALAVMGWCREAYPSLLSLIPRQRHADFVAGMIERVWEEACCSG